jgi:hypothetical protein
MSATKRFLTLLEVSNEFGGSTWTWRARATKGVVASYKPAGLKSKIMIAREEVERFIAAGMRPRVEQAVQKSA